MSYSPFDSFKTTRLKVVNNRRLSADITTFLFPSDLLMIEGSYDSATGVKCRCSAHILSNGTCSLCGHYAGICRCKKIDG